MYVHTNSHACTCILTDHNTHAHTAQAGKSHSHCSYQWIPRTRLKGIAIKTYPPNNSSPVTLGQQIPYEFQWYLDDPLWDLQGCAANSTCCDRGGPWFTIPLSEEVSDDIEVRWCTSADGEESGVEQLEIYIN